MSVTLRDFPPFVVRLFLCAGSQSVTSGFPNILYDRFLVFAPRGPFCECSSRPPRRIHGPSEEPTLASAIPSPPLAVPSGKACQLLKDAMYSLVVSVNCWRMPFTVCYVHLIIKNALYGFLLSVNYWRIPFTVCYFQSGNYWRMPLTVSFSTNYWLMLLKKQIEPRFWRNFHKECRNGVWHSQACQRTTTDMHVEPNCVQIICTC